ncbi:MAG: PAS domain S-box protein [Desulfobulbaceae bacterium]|nr:PAS domain S-box protein [Desulfobulbaceae bacterium]
MAAPSSGEQAASGILLNLQGFWLGRTVFFFARLLLVVLLCVQPFLVQAAEKGPRGIVRVGIFPFAPFNFLDEQGVAQGLNPDLLREIVRDEDWKVTFVPGSWAEGLERLQRQEIDLMLSVAYSPERSERMDYTYESVAELWGQVFVKPEGQSKNITDLAGQRVGVMRQDISGSNFIKTATQFDVLCEIVEFASHGDVFAAVQKGEVAAGVAPQHFGLRHMDEYNLVASTIMFSPFSIYFASKKGRQHELLSYIDAHLSRWKREKNSFYYQKLNYWMSSSYSIWAVPPWLRYGLLLTGFFTLIFAGFTIFLKKMVAQKTSQLQESENKYREIFNSTSEAILIHESATGAILDVNDSTLKMYGYESKEALLAGDIGCLSAQISPFTEHEAQRLLRKSIEEGPQVFEWLAKKQSGETFWIEVSLRNKEMGIAGKVLAVVRDITERKLSAAALLESEERFRTLATLAPVGIYLTSPEGLCQYANPRWCVMAGLSQEEALGGGWMQGLHPDDRDRVFSCWQEMTRSRGRWGYEYRFLTREGKVTWVYGLATPQFDVTGKVIRYIGINTDITERKQAEESLRESEDRHRSLYASSPDGMMLTAPDGRIFSANESLCLLLGRTEAEIKQIGRSGIMDTSDPRLALALEERNRTGRLQNVELTCVRKDGLKIPVELSSTVFQDKDGDTRTSIIIHDITERKQVEAALQASLAEKDILLREVHHRVKNNMAAIIGLFDLQRQTMDDLRSQTVLVELSSRVRAMSLVHEKLYRSESLSQIDFQDYIQSLLSHLRTSFGSPEVQCEVDAQGVALPLDLAVPCGMIINELITNALKYAFPAKRSGTNDAGARIWVTMRHDHDCFTLSVGDNGVGLAAGFDLNTTKTLGLSLVRMLGQHQLGGQYQIEQTHGVRFTLTFSVRNGIK